MSARGRPGRRFGLEIGSALLLLGAVLVRRHAAGPSVLAVLVAGAMLLTLAWRAPQVLAPVARRWQVVGDLMARIVTPIVFAVLYYALLTPIALLRRSFGKSGFHRDPNAPSYWVARAPATDEEQRKAMEHLS